MTSRIKFVMFMLGTIWAVFFVNFIIPIKLGVHPRDLGPINLIGLVTSPLFHSGLGHILANSIPLAVLGFIYSMRFNTVSNAVVVTLYLTLIGNIGVWIFGGTGNHIGASGLIFAFFGYIIAGVFSKGTFFSKIRDIALTIITMMLYGFMIFSFFSIQDGVSWAGHTWGFIAGILLGSRHHFFNSDLETA